MKIRYDKDADAMYIRLKDGEIDSTKEIDRNTIMDLNKNGEIVGIEILFVKERNPKLLKELENENIIMI